MKKCLKCGFDNNDENLFCSECGSNQFSPPYAIRPQYMAPLPVKPVYQQTSPLSKQGTLTFFNMCTIFGFVTSLVGLYAAWIVLEPLAFAAALAGFFKGSKYKPLAIAAFIIAFLGFIIKMLLVLYEHGIVGKWMIEGIFGSGW